MNQWRIPYDPNKTYDEIPQYILDHLASKQQSKKSIWKKIYEQISTMVR